MTATVADPVREALPTRREISTTYKYRVPNGGPPCSYCGTKRASHRIDIKVSWFRGDDERRFICSDCYRRIGNG